MSLKTVTVIPARLGSTRLKEKPLVDIAGKSLIQRVWENARNLKIPADPVVATDSEKVKKEVESFGGECYLTPDDLESGSDRVAYTVSHFLDDADIVVNLQGDEPFIDTGAVDGLIDLAKEEDAGLYTAYFPVDRETALKESVVKVVLNNNGEALYFSRSPIPWNVKTYFRHIGIYVWKKDALFNFTSMKKTELEKKESLEQLRYLENGGTIKLLQSAQDSMGIDTPEDVEMAKKYILKK
ncbi:MAG: 3-deoxy-manno-octulosonate cytidylyltransferase [Elusimicrobiota bacterium]